MQRNFLRKALTVLSAVALIGATVGSASAQVTSADGKCRAALQKAANAVASNALKGIDGCVKAQLKANTGANCNNATPGNPTTDAKGKISGAVTKLNDTITSKCKGGLASATELAVFPSCPSPANAIDNGGSNATAVDAGDAGWTEVGNCQTNLNTVPLVSMRNYFLRPQAGLILAHPNVKNIVKCANAIAKNTTKAFTGVVKARAKAQNTADKVPGPYDYSGFNSSSGTLQTSCETAITTACGPLPADQLALIRSCDTAGAGIGTCACHSAVKAGGGVVALAYEFDGSCPTEVRVSVNSGTGTGGRLTDTVLDTGWTGLGHHVDVHDGFVGRVNLDCTGGANGGADCESCSVTSNCEAGNCRCSNNPATSCTTPFVQSTCGAGNTCIVHFGSPLALSAGGSPVCVSNTIQQELVGTANAGTGTSNTTVKSIARVFLGLSQDRPCPTCSGATVGAVGTCSGGSTNGAACTTNAVHPDFGPTSYQCQPALASNISGAGLKLTLNLTDGLVSLPFNDDCDGGFSGLDCACGVCVGDNSVTCNGDADCAAFGGSCVKGAAGSPPDRQPNKCLDLTCEASAANTAGDSQGECAGAPETITFCDGFLRKGGGGIIPCSNNGDCAGTDCDDSTVPNDACGNCTHDEQPICFRDPITATGAPGTDGAVLVSNFCSPATTNPGINGAGGVPGPGRIKIDWDFEGFCGPSGTAVFEPGGSNCP